MFPGLSSRVEKDIKEIYLKEKFDNDKSRLNRFPINVVDPPRRKHGVFIGASFVANSYDDNAWISRKDFQEGGERALFK